MAFNKIILADDIVTKVGQGSTTYFWYDAADTRYEWIIGNSVKAVLDSNGNFKIIGSFEEGASLS